MRARRRPASNPAGGGGGAQTDVCRSTRQRLGFKRALGPEDQRLWTQDTRGERPPIFRIGESRSRK